ncbi:MAG: SEC-C metal-binding domain-containing protein, partial [Burkholderiales bacterium]
REGFELFGTLLETVKLHVTRTLMRVQVQTQEQVKQAEQQVEHVSNVQYHHADYDEALAEAATTSDKPKAMPFVKAIGKVGRNDACPCGSGKKYKHCHGKLS